jgi:hypothetical protein
MQSIVTYVCIGSYLKLVLIHKFLILDTYHTDTQREQGNEDPWLFFEAKRRKQAKMFRKMAVLDIHRRISRISFPDYPHDFIKHE